MEEIEKPNFYAILPADVRYDNRLSAKEKLLYAEITALSNKEGYCWANNTYFANLYNASNRTIITCINNLVDLGYVDRKLIHKKNSKEVERRLLYPRKEISLPSEENFTTPSEENFTDNNTSTNTINEYISKKSSPPTLEDIEQYVADRKSSVNPKMFFDYYSANNWKDSNNKPVKNWKLKLITWEMRERKKESSCGSSSCQVTYDLSNNWETEPFEGVFKNYE
jgi:hypothetical protein